MAFKSFLILVFLQYGRPQDFFPYLRSFRLTLLFILVTIVLTVLSKPDYSFSKIFSKQETKLYLLLFFLMVVGIPFAFHRRVAFDNTILKYLSNILFYFLVVIHVSSTKKIKLMLFMICISVMFQAGSSLLHGTFQEGRFWSGTQYDANDLAYFLVSLFPLYFLFMQTNERFTKKVFAATGIFVSLLVIMLTGSRGGALGLATVMFFILFSKAVIEQVGYKILLCLLLALTIVANLDKINIERFQSLTNIASDYNITSETGRLGIWKRGFRLASSNPLTGVGVGCFNMALGSQREDEGQVGRWQASHNSFVQILTETGFIGFFIYLSLVLTCLLNFHRLSLVKSKEPERLLVVSRIAGLLKVSFVGSLICAFFLSQAYSTIFTFFFSMSTVLKHLTDKAVPSDAAEKTIIES